MLKGRGLWRGKSKDNDDWVKGYYSDNQMGECWIRFWDTDTKSKTFGKLIAYQVVPETLGECTTQPDMHGNLIFEGDIVKDSTGHIFAVKWVDERAMFILSDLKYTLPVSHFTPVLSYEIIGNIHDNPELLKGGESNG